MKLSHVNQQLRTLSLLLIGFSTTVSLFAIVSHYPGLIDMRFGINGGQVIIDGKPR